MRLQELKNWIETLPLEFLSFSVVNAEEREIMNEEDFVFRYDRPIITLGVDEDNQEILLMSEPSVIEETDEDKIF